MEVKQSSLAAVGTKFSQYPTDGKVEIAFAGKSNVNMMLMLLIAVHLRIYAMC